MLGTRHFLKSAKINSQQEKPICPIAKISSRRTQKSPIRKNKLPQKFRATRYFRNRLNALELMTGPIC